MTRPRTTLTTEPSEALYASRREIYPQSVRGRYRTIKWAALILALGVYYLLPFVRWDRGPHLPSQAVLIDLDKGRFYFFFIELWPQEVYFFAGLLILASFILFLMNAVAGRIWCGYLCPQTVWTDLFMMVERWIEGDRRERMKLDAAPWSFVKLRKRVAKHFTWLMIAWWTGGAWVLYFADAPTLVWSLATFHAPFAAYAAIAVLTFTTYTLAGLMREQVCTYMCPWPRIQAALTDDHSLSITYRYDRGEPRGSVKKNAALRATGAPAGDCVDCNQCVVVCPTGIDIRNGLQLECIQCGLCADACDAVMGKIGRPLGLIAYDTDDNCKRRGEGLAPVYKPVRPRTILYAALIAVVGAIMLTALAVRSAVGLSALHDRNPIHVRLADGSIRNGYTLRVLNKRPVERRLTLQVEGLPGARLAVVGDESEGARVAITAPPDDTHELRALVYAPPGASLARSTPILFRLVDTETGEEATAHDFFGAPE